MGTKPSLKEEKILKLKGVRESKRISLRNLGEAIGVNYTTISYWERGIKEPNEANKRKLQEYLDVPITELLEEDKDYTPLEIPLT